MKNINNYFIPGISLSLMLIIGLFSCSTGIKMEKDLVLISPKIVFSKGACYGECPVYNLTIYNTGMMKYNGIRLTPMLGKYDRQLTEEEYIALVKAFRSANPWKFEDNYDMNIVDLPTTTLSFSDKEKQKTIKTKSGFPEPLTVLEQKLEELIRHDGWVQTDLPPSETAAPVNEILIKNELIIKGTDQMILVRWLREYGEYDMKIVRRLGPESPYWLVSFNQTSIDPDELLNRLKEDPQIESVEFNKKISNRN